MNQKELTETFMMISNLKKPFRVHGLFKKYFSALWVNRLVAKLFNYNFHSLEVVSR